MTETGWYFEAGNEVAAGQRRAVGVAARNREKVQVHVENGGLGGSDVAAEKVAVSHSLAPGFEGEVVAAGVEEH